MKLIKIKDKKLEQEAASYSVLFNEAVKEAQAENRKKGIPNVYNYKSLLIYELPNGEVVTELPEAFKQDSTIN
jgi:hypothetical protein